MISFLLLLVIGGLLLAGFILRVLTRIFFPWIRPDRWSYREKGQEKPRKPEGSVSIDYVPPRQDMKDSRPGNNAPDSDYVDYEEVKQ